MTNDHVRPAAAFTRCLGIATALGCLVTTQPGAAYQEGQVSDGATIEGEVSYSGSVPMKRIIPSDPKVCGQPRDIALIETTEGGMVTDAVVYLEDVDTGKAWPEQEKTPELDNAGCRFHPQLLAMPPGPVDIANTDPVLHNTHAFYGRRTAFNIALPKQGQRIEQDLRRPGIVRVECDEHGFMSARIFVAANPYYAATAQSGAFRITEVPPGEYKLIAYQEEVGPVETAVSVAAGETIKLAVDLANKTIQRQ
jgi:hypothetical protein